MVLKIFIHHMGCDGRAIMATHTGTDQPHKTMIDPFALPQHCDPTKCLADRRLRPLKEGHGLCRTHACCQVTERVLTCARGHRQAGHDCAAVYELHAYEQSAQRCTARPAAWLPVRAPAELGAAVSSWRAPPAETVKAIAARRGLFRAGRALHDAKLGLAEAVRADDAACYDGGMVTDQQLAARRALLAAQGTLQEIKLWWRLAALQVWLEEDTAEGFVPCLMVDSWFDPLRADFRRKGKTVLAPL